MAYDRTEDRNANLDRAANLGPSDVVLNGQQTTVITDALIQMLADASEVHGADLGTLRELTAQGSTIDLAFRSLEILFDCDAATLLGYLEDGE